jgi:hypothetical protein
MTRRRRPRPITITTSEVIEEQIFGHVRGLGATVVAPLSRVLRLAKTGSGQASQAHREFVRAAEFEERPLRGANLNVQVRLTGPKGLRLMGHTLSVDASQLLRLICHAPAHEGDERD